MVVSRVALALAAASAVGSAVAQSQPAYQTHNLTPDGYWHNRYHGILAMSAYGDYDTLCPVQTFTEAEKLKNFPNSTRPPWTVVEEWGPTPSGCQGFSAIVPEMNKVVVVFRGNWDLEQNLTTDVVSWDALYPEIGATCEGCTVNQFALQGYLEAKNATNNWNATRQAYYGAGLVYSITGHGLGGMHSLIHSADFNYQRIAYYSHNYGTPRTFNEAGANWYNVRFNGEAGERGIFNNDQTPNLIPASENYTHTGTQFYYYGVNATNGQPNWTICWTNATNPEDPECDPQEQPGLNTTPQQDHYYYWTPVSACGRPSNYDVNVVNQFLAFEQNPANSVASFSYTPSSTHSSARSTRTTVMWASTTVTSTRYAAATNNAGNPPNPPNAGYSSYGSGM